MADERRGLSKMAPAFEKRQQHNTKAGREDHPGHAGESHTIEDHGDGTFTSHMKDGTSTDHPDHLHLLAHIGHHVTGGDAHHVTHHDGMEAHSHIVHESGEHEDGGNDPHGSLDKMMGGEMSEGEPEPDGDEEPEPSYGGMGA